MSFRSRGALLLALAILASTAVGGESKQLDIPLTIYEAAGAARSNAPCSSGVLIPCGLLKEAEGIAVISPGGKAVPAQFKVLERWREKADAKSDLSVKWLLVTFLAELPAGGKVVYRLKRGANPAPARPVKLIKKGQDYELGGVLFKQDFSSPFKILLTDADGKEISASELPVKLSVYELGPVRSCLKAESETVPGKFGFTAWIYAYSGLKRWDMTLTINNMPRKTQGPLYMKDLSVIWAPPELKGASGGLLGGEAGKAATVKAPAYLYQASDGTDEWKTMEKWRSEFVMDWSKEKKLRKAGVPSFRGYKVMAGGAEKAKGKGALGWAALNAAGKGALVCVRHFKQNYPKAVEVSPGKLIVRLWPKYYQGYGGLQWLDDASRKDHDLSFTLTDKAVTAASGALAARAFEARLIAHGIGKIKSKKPGPNVKVWNRIANRNWVTFGGDVTDRIRRRYHGSSMAGFRSSANPYSAYVLAAYGRHSSGMTPQWVDDYQYPRDAKMLSTSQYCSTARGAGRYRPGTGHHGYKAWNVSHFCCQEIFDSWRLFGDPVAEDAIRKLAVFCMAYVDYREKNPRSLPAGTRADGLPLGNLCQAYRITGDPKMLEALQRFADVSWKQVNKQRGNYGVMGSWEGGREQIDKPFMMCQVIDGLRSYYAITGSERTLDQITGMLDFILDEGTIEKDGYIYGWGYVIKLKKKTEPDRFRRLILPKIKDRKELGRKERYKRKTSYTHLAPKFAWAHKYTGIPEYRIAIDNIDGIPYPHRSKAYTTMYPERSDKTPPATVKDLKAEALGGGKVKLTWTTPADAARMQVKHAALPMVRRAWPDKTKSHTSWWAAENAEGEPAAKAGKQSVTLETVPVGKRHFALKTWDAAHNRSAMSNQVAVEVK